MNEYMIALYLDLLCPGFHYVYGRTTDDEWLKEKHIEGLIEAVTNEVEIE